MYDHQWCINPWGGASKLATNRYGGQSLSWTIRTVDHPCWTIRGVDNPQVGNTTMNRVYYIWETILPSPDSIINKFPYFLRMIIVSSDPSGRADSKFTVFLCLPFYSEKSINLVYLKNVIIKYGKKIIH